MIVTDNLTGEVFVIEEPEIVEDIEIPPQLPTAEERLEALESAVLEMVLGGAV